MAVDAGGTVDGLDNRGVNLFDPFSSADRLDLVAAELASAMRLDDWWGPARIAFDAEVNVLHDTALSLAHAVRSSP